MLKLPIADQEKFKEQVQQLAQDLRTLYTLTHQEQFKQAADAADALYD